ncbi:flavodoxin family protein [Treponema sp. R6D11]
MVALLNGSPNKDGNTSFLLTELSKELDALGVSNNIYNIQDAIDDAKWSFCTECTKPCTKVCFVGTKLEALYEEILKSDGLVIGSPVYFGLPTGQIKAFFDKSRGYRGKYVGKKLAAVTVGHSRFGGQEMAANAVYSMALVHGMDIINDGFLDLDAGHFGVQAQAPAKDDEWALSRIKILAKRLSNCTTA